jgi:endonuclease G
MKLFITLILFSGLAFGHGGGLDSNGGHHNRKSGGYHCHREPCISSQRIQRPAPPIIVKQKQQSDNGSNECNGHLRYGTPSQSDQILCRQGYALGFDYEHKSAVWVAYRLTPEIHDSANVPRMNDFRVDSEVPPEHRKTLADFEEPVFDRGHLVSSASLDANTQMNSETFLLSNMVPQLPGLNRAAWKGLENRERKWSSQRGELYIYTGVLFLSDAGFIGNRVPIPSHFYKILFDPRRQEIISFLVPHRRVLTSELERFLVNVDTIEEWSGLDFVDVIDDQIENRIESVRSDMW